MSGYKANTQDQTLPICKQQAVNRSGHEEFPFTLGTKKRNPSNEHEKVK